MSKKEQMLSKATTHFKITAVNARVNVWSENVFKPIVRYEGSFQIEENGSLVNIETKNRGLSILNFGTSNGKTSINISNCSISGSTVSLMGGGITINGEKVHANEFSTDEISIDLILPSDSEGIELELKTTSGNITLRDLNLEKLAIITVSGATALVDVDAVATTIKSTSGDINAEIAESIMNYSVTAKSIGGLVHQTTHETSIPKILMKKHTLDIRSTSGDIAVEFKGRNR